MIYKERSTSEIDSFDGMQKAIVEQASRQRQEARDRVAWELDDYFDAAGVENPLRATGMDGFKMRLREGLRAAFMSHRASESLNARPEPA